MKAELGALQPFAVAERYPILLTPDVSRADIAPLIELAQKAAAWAARLIADRAATL